MNCCCTKAPLIVSIGEDATRIIGRVDYDSQTDRLVGFVMPVNELGLPVTDTYLATSFITIEKFFSTSTVAKYAFLYGPAIITIAFILACFSTDNCFTTEHVLKRWTDIHSV